MGFLGELVGPLRKKLESFPHSFYLLSLSLFYLIFVFFKDVIFG